MEPPPRRTALNFYKDAGRWRKIINLCHRGLAMDPHSDTLVFSLMEACKKLGNTTEARMAYLEYEQRLKQDLDVETPLKLKQFFDELQ